MIYLMISIAFLIIYIVMTISVTTVAIIDMNLYVYGKSSLKPLDNDGYAPYIGMGLLWPCSIWYFIYSLTKEFIYIKVKNRKLSIARKRRFKL